MAFVLFLLIVVQAVIIMTIRISALYLKTTGVDQVTIVSLTASHMPLTHYQVLVALISH